MNNRTTTQLPTVKERPRSLSPSTNASDGYVTYIVVPPDGGWGWVVMVAAFFSNVVEGAVIFSVGCYTVPLATEFDASSSAVSLAGSLLVGFHQLNGPIVSAMCNRWGFRVVSMTGSFLTACFIALCYFVTALWQLYIVFGLLAGIALSMLYLPGAVIVSFYFLRWRALAVCLSLCGAGVGGAIFPIALDTFIAKYGWRYGTLVEGAILLMSMCTGMLYRPIKPTPVTVVETARPSGAGNAANAASAGGAGGVPRRTSFAANTKYPTMADTYSVSRSGVLTNNSSYSNVSIITVPFVSYVNPVRSSTSMPFIAVPEQLRRRCSWCRCTRCRGYVRRWLCSRRKGKHAGVRPLYRDDAFYGGSVKSLRSYTPHPGTDHDYVMTVTRLPTLRDVEEERASSCKLCPEAFTRILATMLDVSLLRSPSFLMLALSGCLLQAVLLIPFMYSAQRAVANGVDAEVARYLVTSISASSVATRLLCGVIATIPGVSVIVISSTGAAIGGVAMLVSGLSTAPSFQFACCSLYGFSLASFFSLRTLVIVKLLGLQRLTNTFGLLLLCQGIAVCIGPPLASALKDVTENYETLFYITGINLLLSSVIVAFLPYVNKRERAKNGDRTLLT